MKNEKILSWSISIMLIGLVFAEALIRYFVEIKSLPFALATRFIMYYNTYGIWVRLGTFSILWFFFIPFENNHYLRNTLLDPEKRLVKKMLDI